MANAEAICKKAQAQLAVQLTKVFGRQEIKPEQLVDFTTSTAIPNVEDQLKQLRALPQPSEGQAVLQRYYSEFEKGITQLKRDPALVNGSKVPDAIKRADALARSFGIDRCVR